jgi:hypothetical protein
MGYHVPALCQPSNKNWEMCFASCLDCAGPLRNVCVNCPLHTKPPDPPFPLTPSPHPTPRLWPRPRGGSTSSFGLNVSWPLLCSCFPSTPPCPSPPPLTLPPPGPGPGFNRSRPQPLRFFLASSWFLLFRNLPSTLCQQHLLIPPPPPPLTHRPWPRLQRVGPTFWPRWRPAAPHPHVHSASGRPMWCR